VRDDRKGESLWYEWSGYGYEHDDGGGVVYVTMGHVDMDNDLVRRALASALQRDGVCDSLSDGYRLVDSGSSEFGFVGFVDGDSEMTACDENGETQYGDTADGVLQATWHSTNP
jgi:hypothetical protein